MKYQIIHGDCLDELKKLPENSVDSICTDPPYGLSFMGKKWDYDVPSEEVWKECLRVLKPGGHLLSFAGTRTQHRMAVRIEDAGFEIRDMIAWIYGSGFPKSLDISKAIDKVAPRLGQFDAFAKHFTKCWERSCLKRSEFVPHFPHYKNAESIMAQLSNWKLAKNVPSKQDFHILRGLIGLSDEWQVLIDRVEAEREVVGKSDKGSATGSIVTTGTGSLKKEFDITSAATDQAKQWEGWGTALKPAHEPIVVARKPLSEKTVAENVLTHGTGGINIEKSRVPTQEDVSRRERILAGEVVCNGFCDKHESYPRSLADICAFSPQQFLDYLQHISSELKAYSSSYSNPLRDEASLPGTLGKALLGVPCDYDLLALRVEQCGREKTALQDSPSGYPTLSRLCDVHAHPEAGDDLVSVLSTNGVLTDTSRLLDSLKSNQLNDSNLHLVFVAVLFAYSCSKELILQHNDTTCKNKSKGERWPSNLIHDGSEEVLECFPNESHRFFYSPKASKKDRDEGLDCTRTVKYNGSINPNKELCKEENMVAVQLLQRVISEPELVSFSIGESGVNIMAQCQSGSLSTIKTTISKIIESKILNLLTLSLTSGFTEDASLEKMSGGSHAESVGSLKKWLLTITNGQSALALGASDVALKMLLQIRNEENWNQSRNIHSTVKPTALMRYLVKLVTPPGGTVLDPFTGSGSTGKACKLEGFEFIGIEREEEYVKIAEARIAAVTHQPTLV